MTRDAIVTDTCDSCGRRGPVVKCHDSGDVPSFSACAMCSPRDFEEQARLDVESWLRGGAMYDSEGV